jgi:predicted nucleic acid-binding protein
MPVDRYTGRESVSSLSDHSVHRRLSVADYLVAATAIRLKLVVLHEDADFETMARLVPQLKQERIGRVA